MPKRPRNYATSAKLFAFASAMFVFAAVCQCIGGRWPSGVMFLAVAFMNGCVALLYYTLARKI